MDRTAARAVCGQRAPVLYNRGLLDLARTHPALVAVASAVGAGIFVTRPAGAEFLPVARSIVKIGETFPPISVLAPAVPALGFGVKPVLVALVLYGLLPVFESTLAGLSGIPEAALEAAHTMGMSARQRLFGVELPLALPVILNGLRLAVVINLGTATIGSPVAAKSIGDVIIDGPQTSKSEPGQYTDAGGELIAVIRC